MLLFAIVCLICLLAAGAIYCALDFHDKLTDERCRSATFEQRNTELFSALLQAQAQRDAYQEELEGRRMVWGEPVRLRALPGGRRGQ